MKIEEFLLERIAEDEVAATAAGNLQFWRYDNEPLGWSLENDGGERILTVDSRTIAVGNYWNHAARHLPARVLAECAAKRHLIELHHTAVQQVEMAGPGPAAPILTAVAGTYAATLRVLASTYADHPDYREEWKP